MAMSSAPRRRGAPGRGSAVLRAGVDGHGEPLATVVELAAYFVAQIRAFRLDGPYIIAGYCGGGTIALEVAPQLVQDGADISVPTPAATTADPRAPGAACEQARARLWAQWRWAADSTRRLHGHADNDRPAHHKHSPRQPTNISAGWHRPEKNKGMASRPYPAYRSISENRRMTTLCLAD